MTSDGVTSSFPGMIYCCCFREDYYLPAPETNFASDIMIFIKKEGELVFLHNI